MSSIVFFETEDWAFCQHRFALALALREAGHRVGVISPAGGKVTEIRAWGFDHYPVAVDRTGTNPLSELRAVAGLTRLLKRVRPDLLHNFSLKSALYGTLAGRASGVPSIVNSITGLGYVFSGDGMKRRALRVALRVLFRWALSCRRVYCVFQNPDDMSVFARYGLGRSKQRIIIRGSGVDTRAFTPSPAPGGIPVILFAARLIWDKGVGELIEAVRALRADGVGFRLRIAGVPDASNPACIPESKIEEWRAEGIAEFPGYLSDMSAPLRESHIACLPSYYGEGVPKFLLEAAASGRPAVTTDMPGCREAVRDGVNGLLVPPRDARALAAALKRLLSDPDLRRRMGEKGREMAVAEFSNETVARQVLALYRLALERERRS